jgi:hypothetical protein
MNDSYGTLSPNNEVFWTSEGTMFKIGDFVTCHFAGYYRITGFHEIDGINEGQKIPQVNVQQLYDSKGNTKISKQSKSCLAASLMHADYQNVIIDGAMTRTHDAMEEERKLENMLKFEHRLTLTEALKTKPDGTPISKVYPGVSVGQIKKLIISAMKHQATEYDGPLSDWQEKDIENQYYKDWIKSQ